MRVSIVVEDSVVCVDGACIHGFSMDAVPDTVHALQWQNTTGHIEHRGANNEPITSLPDWANTLVAAWQVEKNLLDNPPPPTEEEQLTFNRAKSSTLLQESDWSALPDVGLVNQSEWLAYRAALRDIRTNTTLSPVWPDKPQAIWA